MISRRANRIIAIQILFSGQIEENFDLTKALDFQKSRINQIYSLHLDILLTFYLTVQFIETYRDIQEKKMVKESFEIIDDALLKSAIYKSLQEDKVFQQYAHKRILDLEYYDLKKLLLDLFASEAYSKYCLDYSKASELSVFVDFLKKRIPKLESLVSKLEFDYPCIEQDYDSIYVYYRKHAQDQNEWSLNTDFHMFEKSFRMSTQLIEFYFEHQTVFYSKINQKLKGWNIERIPQIEIMIVLIAIIEIYTLKDIPIKVSINEYIEISKSFTSSKGKDFINGIIHKITDEWLATGELVKIMS